MLDLYFLTTNRVKFAHLSYMLRSEAVRLKPSPDYGRPYHEPRIFDREKLLRKSIESANTRMFRREPGENSIGDDLFEVIEDNELELRRNIADIMQDRFFIIEDTSVIIEALSKEHEVPGVDVKYWMRATSFAQLDKQLRENGNNRKVTVRSDIVLYIPRKFRSKIEENYKVFTGVAFGSVVDRESLFETNSLYPWLDNKTFNKWFVPDGVDSIFSTLSIDEALKFDFRRSAIDEMLDFLYKIKILEQKKPKPTNTAFQESLFGESDLIICGPTCSGKSTVSEYLAENYGYFHIEASDYMHLLYYQQFSDISSLTGIHSFAKKVLDEKPEVVASEIKKERNSFGHKRYVISGFRSPAELIPFENEIKAGVVNLVYLNSSRELRFARNRTRARVDSLENYADFVSRDDMQLEMGLSELKIDTRGTKFLNESSLQVFKNDFVEMFLEHTPKVSLFKSVGELVIGASLENAIICALFINQKDSTYYTTTQISKFINNSVSRSKGGSLIMTHKDNVSRYFNMGFYPYFRISAESSKKRYRLSATGLSKAREIMRLLKG
ncbi:non-canonical purine NTP pyrophosphatase [Marinobacter sp. LV10MA510-1]|uniref:non-canonical purine NTP pyrophosphatase n=1 Tax=Marinobacter sp. LV10MA510-1 TaxID=1415567 RepID=UPI000BFA2B84|nr:non-canonical purine NTP pyrophosphatase [Marinobacter sp. LV10MA510-1]PFG11401.1 dephospho-CoA kinase [Marinobacter sp. LV10MA510-1]